MAALPLFRSRRLFLIVLALVFAGIATAFAMAKGLSLPGSDFVRVTRVQTGGGTENPTSVMVEFSADMVPNDKINQPESLEDAPFTVTPPISAIGRWRTPRVYVAALSAPLSMASEYAVVMKPGITDLAGRPLKNGYVFRTMGLRPVAVKATHEKERTVIALQFNMPVEPAVLKKFLSLKDANKKAVAYSILETAATANMHLECALPKEKGYTLSIAPGLTSVMGPIPTSERFTSNLDGIKASKPGKAAPLAVNTVYADRTTAGLRILVRFSEPSGENPPATDLRDYFTVSPAVKNLSVTPRYSAWYDTIELRGDFKPQEQITVTVKKGFSINGVNVLDKDATSTVLMPDYQASLKFPESGHYLTPSRSTTVAVEAVNIKEIQYTLLKLYENNLTVSMVSNNYAQFSVPEHLSQLVKAGEVKLTAATNETVRRGIDIAALAGTKRGVFLLTLNGVSTPAGNGNPWDLRNISNTIILTDIGICTAVRDNGILVWANSIASGKPLSGATVRIYSTSNQIMAHGKTDANGLFTLNRTSAWPDGLAPYLATVSTDNDESFVQFRSDLQARSGYETSGRAYIDSGYEAFLFCPRGVFRPGDTVEVKALVRDTDLKAARNVPLQWRILTPTNREMRRGKVTINEHGTALFGLDLPSSAPTGSYRADLFVPGNENAPIGSAVFAVEEFVPPRLEVTVDAALENKKTVLLPKGKIDYKIESRYLFGTPASGMRYEGDFTVVPKTFTHPQWADYIFEDQSRSFAPIRERAAISGNLNEKGEAQTDYTAGNWSAPSILSVLFTARVQEDGGRWTSRTQVTDWFPAQTMLGIQNTTQEHPVGEPVSLNVAAINPDGKPGALTKAKVEFFRVDTHYTWIEQDGRSYYDSEEELVPIGMKDATVSLKNGTGTITVNPPRWGEYLVRVSDEHSTAAASIRFYAYSMDRTSSGQGSGLMDRVTLELDKKRYTAGNTAKLTIRAPFKGKALLTAQTSKQLWAKVFELEETEKTISLPVTADMGPNAYLVLWLLRPVAENETGGEMWSAHRAIGITSLALDPSLRKLSVSLDAPERATPGKPVDITVTVKAPDGTPVSGDVALALVDEGILSLTGFKTPDPLGFFFGKRALSARLYDMYDFLMPPELRAAPLLHPGGDAMGAGIEAFMSNLQRNQEILTVFLGAVQTDEQGRATTRVSLPEYSGKGRIMAVAASESFMGSAERALAISRDIVTEAATPRALAPGDTFTMPITVFATNPEKTGHATITASTEGPLELNGETSFTVPLEASAAGQRKLSLTGRALDANAVAAVLVTTTVPGEPDNSYTQRLEIPVRTPFPRVSRTGSGTIAPDANIKLSLPSDWVSGTQNALVSVSSGPKADIMALLSQLAAYPYGCLEQTVSKAWPYLTFPDLVAKINPALANTGAMRRALEAAVARLGTMQNPDGSFRMWPDQGWSTYRWGSVYATHFLLEAQKYVPVPEDMLTPALEWLELMLAQTPDQNGYVHSREEDTTKAYAAFVLTRANKTPLGWLQHLSEKQNNMYPSGRIFLGAALALHQGSAAPLRTLANAVQPVSEVHSPTLDSTVRNEALLLLAWSLVEPGAAEARALAEKLLASLQKNYEYNSTQENGYSALALGTYLNATADSRKPFDVVITDNQGQLLAQGNSNAPLTVRAANLPGLSPLTIASAGPGSPMFSWVVSGTPTTAPAAVSNNLALSRNLSLANGTPLIPDQKGVLHVKQGDLVNITLTINPGASPLRDAVLVDILPGGLEVENPRLNPNPANNPDNNTNEKDENAPAMRIDVRDDRIIVFYNQLTSPTTHTYTVRAVTKGLFTLPPAAAQGMYAPMRHARTGHGMIVVE